MLRCFSGSGFMLVVSSVLYCKDIMRYYDVWSWHTCVAMCVLVPNWNKRCHLQCRLSICLVSFIDTDVCPDSPPGLWGLYLASLMLLTLTTHHSPALTSARAPHDELLPSGRRDRDLANSQQYNRLNGNFIMKSSKLLRIVAKHFKIYLRLYMSFVSSSFATGYGHNSGKQTQIGYGVFQIGCNENNQR